MTRYVIESWFWLLYFEHLMRFRRFERLQSIVRDTKVSSSEPAETGERLTRCVDLACVLYAKPVLCLQRSAVNAVLLKRNGWPAQLVIGVQLLPFRSHAWVELDGRVLNDKSYITESFQVLERC